MTPFIDLHSHHPLPGHQVVCIYNRLLTEPHLPLSGYYSAGLHPWHADRLTPAELWKSLEAESANQKLLAFGEAGLDKACHIPLAVQKEIFKIHLDLAEDFRLPVVIHCVKAWQEVLEMTSNHGISTIVHGYNGSTELTDQLVKSGYCFSVGKAVLNPKSKIRASISRIPIDSLFCETDESDTTIMEVYRAVAESLSIPGDDLKERIHENFRRIFRRVPDSNR